MKRILHIVGKMDRAGAETMIMNLYRTMDRSKFQFDFVCFSKDKGDYNDEIKDLGGHVYAIAESNPVKRMFALKNLLQKHPEYKIVHSHTLFSNAFHLVAAKMAKVPHRIAHAHNTSDLSKNKFISTIYQGISRKIIKKHTTQFIGCGDAAAKFLFQKQKEVLLLPNSIDTNYFAEIGNDQNNYLNNLYQLDEHCLKIIQVGRLQTVKNHFFSIQIAKELKNKGINFKMFFVGQGNLNGAIKNEIELQNLTQEVLLLGVRSDIPQLMAGADVLLMPSLHEGFPVVLVESQSVGIPALIADTISPEVDLGVDLVAFEDLNGSVSAWVEKLIAMKKKEKISKNNRLQKLAQQGFDIHTNTIKLADLYNRMN